MSALPRQIENADQDTRPRSVARSHVGLVRTVNEDRIFDCAEGRLWAVADGMGGHRGGDLAAQAVVDSLRSLVQDCPRPSIDEALHAIERANLAIIKYNEANRTSSGATVVLALWDGRQMNVAWAGDSRAYVLRDRTAELLTHDHSVVQELVDAGLLTPEGAAKHPQANIVTRALGITADVSIETISFELQVGETLMLCSDGLSRTLDVQSASSARDLNLLADELMANALDRDGTDNLSVVIVEAVG